MAIRSARRHTCEVKQNFLMNFVNFRLFTEAKNHFHASANHFRTTTTTTTTAAAIATDRCKIDGNLDESKVNMRPACEYVDGSHSFSRPALVSPETEN